MTSNRNKVTVKIAGKEYTLVGVESDEYIQKVGLYIDKKMNEIMIRNSTLSTSLAAVLSALNVADDFFKTRESEYRLKQELMAANQELQMLKDECNQLKEENSSLSGKNTTLQLELAKREAELGEVRKNVSHSTSGKVHRPINQKVIAGYDM